MTTGVRAADSFGETIIMSNPFSTKYFYILDLFCIAVISRTDFDNSILVKHNLTVYLVVHFHAPVVLAALRHSYLVDSAIGTAGQKEEKSQ